MKLYKLWDSEHKHFDVLLINLIACHVIFIDPSVLSDFNSERFSLMVQCTCDLWLVLREGIKVTVVSLKLVPGHLSDEMAAENQ
jgi:hypothetical protein